MKPRQILAGLFLAGTLTANAQTNITITNGLDKIKRSVDVAYEKQSTLAALNRFYTVEYDRFTQISTVKSKREYKIGRESFRCSVLCMTKGGTMPETVTLHFSSVSADWIFLNYSRFIVLWDEQRKDFGSLKVDGSILAEGVLEQMMAKLTFDEFKSMANARSISCRLGLQEFDVTGNVRTEWQALVKYFEATEAERSILSRK